MYGQVGWNKSEFHKKKLMGYWGGWRISEGFGIYLHLLHFQIVFKGRPRFHEKSIAGFIKKSFLKENCYFRESQHTDWQRPQGILDLYVAARQGFPELQMFHNRRDIDKENTLPSSMAFISLTFFSRRLGVLAKTSYLLLVSKRG